MARRNSKKLNYKLVVSLAVAVLVIIFIFAFAAPGQVAKFSAAQRDGAINIPPIEPPVRAIYNKYLCCPNPLLGDMDIMDSTVKVRGATVKEKTICSDNSKHAVTITYDTNQPTPAYVTYKKKGDSDANIKSHSDYCQPKMHQLIVCNLASGTYEYRLKADTHAAARTCQPVAISTQDYYPSANSWATFKT